VTASDVINPATEELLRTVEQTDEAGVDDAIARAKEAQRDWARLAPAERAAALRAFAAPVDAHVHGWHELEVANSGHPVSNAEWEAGHVRDVLQYYSATPERLTGKQIPVAGGLDVTFNEPLGVVGVITPWNFPMTIASWGFAPALAAGNAVLVKPAEWTPLTTVRLGELAVDAGLPADLFQVLPGKGSVVGERFVTHPDVRKLVFTGSTEVGTRVMAGAAAQVKRVTLELGGKSANIVFDDCDLEKAAATAPYGVFDNAGQDCCARSRILVQRSVYDRFMELLEPAVKGVVVGDPRSMDTEMGPLVSKSHWDTVASYVPDDAPVAFRGDAPSGPGYWFPPTVLTPSRTDRTVTEEIFGPVVTVLPFDEADAIALANDPTGCRIHLDRQPVPRAASRAVESGNRGQFALVGALQHAVQRVGQSGLGRNWAPTPLSFTETKNVFYAIGEADGFDPTTRQGAVITGGAGGIGLATAQRMHARVRRSIGDIDRQRRHAADELDGLFVPVDVSNEAAVNSLDTAADIRRCDIAFNNAGSRRPTTMSSRPPSCPRGRRYRTSTSSRCICPAGRRCVTWCLRRRVRSSTPPRSSR
jgi:betaine-aldehyde dehydrogenase